MRWIFAIIPMLMIALAQTAAGFSNMTLNPAASLAGGPLRGNVSVTFDNYTPNMALEFFIDDEKAADANLTGLWIGSPDNYTFASQSFSYSITATGNNSWITRPAQPFGYTITAAFSGGGSASYSGDGTVNSGEGLKFIYNGSKSIAAPSGTTWSVSNTNPGSIMTQMMAACGCQSPCSSSWEKYAGYDTDIHGWVTHTLTRWKDISGTANKYVTIEAFDGTSIGAQRYGGGPGGIFECISGSCQALGSGRVTFNGTTGNITVNSFNADASYKITYLPPNGPLLCAWTGYTETSYQPWSKNTNVSGQTSNSNLYVKNWTAQMLNTTLPAPACPAGVEGCQHNVEKYEVVKISDPSGSVTVSQDQYLPDIIVLAMTSSPVLANNYTLSIALSDLGLTAPEETGEHNIAASLSLEGQAIDNKSANFNVGEDGDGDGWTVQAGDCNDDISIDPSNCPAAKEECDASTSACAICIYPGAAEYCDSIDNNCNGKTDEDWPSLGQTCGNPNVSEAYWSPDSACGGTLKCDENRTGVLCLSPLNAPPGGPDELDEVCNNSIDDDCDGNIDELGCIEVEGTIKTCGSNASWSWCGAGTQQFLGGAWTKCITPKDPREEVCNGIDDDCDGIIDNINGGNSVATTKCACYNGGLKGSESTNPCNGIDDNCNGQIDESQTCCQAGTKPCSFRGYVGVCANGTVTCSNGIWSDCSIKAQSEICGNGLDDNCNGQVDENCEQAGCFNQQQDANEQGIDCGGVCANPCEYGLAPLWYALAAVGAVLIVIFAFVFLRKRSSASGI